VVNGAQGKVNPQGVGTKVSAHYRLVVAPGATQTILLRLSAHRQDAPLTAQPRSSARALGKPTSFTGR